MLMSRAAFFLVFTVRCEEKMREDYDVRKKRKKKEKENSHAIRLEKLSKLECSLQARCALERTPKMCLDNLLQK